MSFFGMGPMEILLILVIAFVFLGPERMVDAARLLGKAVREGRRLASELPQVVIEDDDIRIVNYGSSPTSSGAKNPGTEEQPGPPSAPDGPGVKEGPVSFKGDDETPAPGDSSVDRDL